MALDPLDQGPQDACGVFGVWAPGEDVAKLTYFGLYALQHRGQESAGIAVSNGRQILVYKDMGLVSQVFDESTLESLKGHLAIGHSRYSTTGASTWQNAQPTFHPTLDGSLALAHNGNLINTRDLAEMLDDVGALEGEAGPARQAPRRVHQRHRGRHLAARPPRRPDGRGQAVELLPLVKGAYSFVWMNENTLFAARGPQGIRPLVLGRLRRRSWVVASEDAALATVGASVVREIEGPASCSSHRRGRSAVAALRRAGAQGCVFEYVYLARPDATIRGAACTRPGSRWAADWLRSSPSRPTW
ncbi:MAG: hypothetical protein R2734_14220 [Nocardioides sp.]